VTALAQIAPATRLRRLHRNACPGTQRPTVTIQGARPDSADHPGKLVSEYQRTLKTGVTDPPVEIGMEITAADTGRRDTDQRLFAPRPARMRHGLDPQITRAASMVDGLARFMRDTVLR
jgi:hypothetical protein